MNKLHVVEEKLWTPDCEPRPKFHTARNPKLVTLAPRVRLVNRALGGRFMPWQDKAVDVALELDPLNPCRWRYDTVVIIVPRQAGKTYLLRQVMIDRLLFYVKHPIMMTAQTGRDARKRWAQIPEALQAEKNPQRFKLLRGQGSEQLLNLKNGSTIAPFAPTPKSVHGDTLPLVTVDEAWAFDEEAGLALENAINPTQVTVIDSQLWIVSTRGTAKSGYLNALIEKGRAAVSDPDSRTCYIEYSADEKKAAQNPYSDETLSFHPALGHTQTPEKLRNLGETMSQPAWVRSILNLNSTENENPIDPAMWDSLGTLPKDSKPVSCMQTAIGIDIAVDGSTASIAAGWTIKDDDGQTITAARIVYTAPGVDWLIPKLEELRSKGYKNFYLDPSGPTRSFYERVKENKRIYRRITPTTTRQYSTACQFLIDATSTGSIIHSGDMGLAQQVQYAAYRPMGGVIAFDSRQSQGNIDGLRALTIAAWAGRTRHQKNGIGIV